MRGVTRLVARSRTTATRPSPGGGRWAGNPRVWAHPRRVTRCYRSDYDVCVGNRPDCRPASVRQPELAMARASTQQYLRLHRRRRIWTRIIAPAVGSECSLSKCLLEEDQCGTALLSEERSRRGRSICRLFLEQMSTRNETHFYKWRLFKLSITHLV